MLKMYRPSPCITDMFFILTRQCNLRCTYCYEKHLNMVEIQVTTHNKPDLDKFYLEGRMYKDHFYHLYDEGLVYEVMRERIRKGHNYSVLDCNSLVENHRHMKNARLGMNMDTITGMCSK